MELARLRRVYPSFVACTGPFAVAAAATDISVLTGSATKRIVVQRVTISGTQTTGGSVNVALVKRSADDTGGTPVIDTGVPLDSVNSVTAVSRHYTANPAALGTLVGRIDDAVQFIGAPAALFTPPLVFDFTDIGRHPPVLRGVTQILAINLGTATIAGGSLDVVWEWTEE